MQIDWDAVETVLLDMDGTLLDLAYDTHFWTEHLPVRYAELRGMTVEASRNFLAPIFESTHGTLDWYCLDYWSARLDVDIVALKRETAERVAWLEGSQAFLKQLRDAGRPLWLVTNAHHGSLGLKVEQTGLDAHLDRVFTTHDFGHAKEDPRFWQAFAEQPGVNLRASRLIDDNLSVLSTAHDSGVGQCLAINQPDSRVDARAPDNRWPSVNSLSELLGVAGL